MTTISIAPFFEQTQHSSEILPKKSCETSRVVYIITIIITGLAAIGVVIASVITGILPLLSICALAIPLLLISLFLLRKSSLQTKTPAQTDVKAPPTSLPFLLEINENTKHTKILEHYGEIITDWSNLPHIFGETTPSLLNKAWKINHSKTALFATTGVIYSPRIHCCCNLLIMLEHNTSISNLDILNISCEIPNIQEGQCVSMPWKNSDGSSNKKKLGLPNFLGFIEGPDPESHNHHPVVAFALAQTAYSNCLNEAVNQGADMIQVPLISTAPAKLSQNPQEAASWKAAIQTGLVTALAKFATSNPNTIMNVVVVSSPGLGLSL
ncbi:hypothetical protein SBV42_04240 [Chlamydia crocodili]|uniref:Macro domain-containing protein n=1 Tax=Chlamydia crocodili TaxID=2766982 RepID=A0ABX8CDH3_9CHLA|nr:hypothetical protein [Chlamydia crocodili]QVE48967.1 hypothetical protein H9Q19_04610 [Chlamydia crocodili]